MLRHQFPIPISESPFNSHFMQMRSFALLIYLPLGYHSPRKWPITTNPLFCCCYIFLPQPTVHVPATCMDIINTWKQDVNSFFTFPTTNPQNGPTICYSYSCDCCSFFILFPLLLLFLLVFFPKGEIMMNCSNQWFVTRTKSHVLSSQHKMEHEHAMQHKKRKRMKEMCIQRRRKEGEEKQGCRA